MIFVCVIVVTSFFVVFGFRSPLCLYIIIVLIDSQYLYSKKINFFLLFFIIVINSNYGDVIMFLVGLFVGIFVSVFVLFLIAPIFAKNSNQKENPQNRKSEKIYLGYIGQSDVKIEYVDNAGEKTERNISIRNLYISNNKMYITAFCHLRNEIRNFKIESILKMFVDNAEVNATSYFKNNIE